MQIAAKTNFHDVTAWLSYTLWTYPLRVQFIDIIHDLGARQVTPLVANNMCHVPRSVPTLVVMAIDEY